MYYKAACLVAELYRSIIDAIEVGSLRLKA